MRIIVGWILLILLARQGLAQSNTFYGVKVHQSARSGALTSSFKQAQIFELQTQLLDRFVRAHYYDGRVNLVLDEILSWKMMLTQHDLRGANFRLRSKKTGENSTGTKMRNITFRGYLIDRPESRIRLSIDGDFLYGFVDDGEEIYFIEPLVRFVSAPANHYVLYRRDQIIESNSPHKCGMIEMEEANQFHSIQESNRRSAPACLTTELAIAMDVEYIAHLGGEISAINQVISVMNTVDPNFQGTFESDINFQIVECFVPVQDPVEWTNTVDGGTLLANFRSWGNSGGFLNEFDLGQLWTKRNFHYEDEYGVVGLAYIGTTCNYSRFHLLEHFTSNVQKLRVLTAHEIGHNFAARHDTVVTSYIMKPSINSSATNFSTQSQDYVNPSLPNRTCLAACGTPCDYLIEVSSSGSYEAMGIIHTIGTVSISTNSVFSAPEVFLNPNFTSNTGVVLEINNDGCDN